MNHLFLTPITKAVNAYLHLDPESKVRFQTLKGRVIAFEFLPFHFSFQCTFNENGMQIISNNTETAETVIKGTPLQMVGAALARNERQQFFAEDVLIEGNAELGQELINLFDELEIDWEEYASTIIGDVPAYYTNHYFNKMSNWVKQTKNNFIQNANEYIHEEKTWFPTHEALQDFFTDIDILRLDVDRIEAKLLHYLSNNLDKDTE